MCVCCVPEGAVKSDPPLPFLVVSVFIIDPAVPRVWLRSPFSTKIYGLLLNFYVERQKHTLPSLLLRAPPPPPPPIRLSSLPSFPSFLHPKFTVSL